MKGNKIASCLVGILLLASPVLANPVEDLIINMRAAGFQLVLLWLLTLAVVYGILSHIELPKSITTRGVIAIVASFMVLIAAAGTQAAGFISTLMTSSIVVAFGLIIAMIFLEITGTKIGGEHVFAKHPKFFATALLVLLILIFIGAGGLEILNIPNIGISLSDPLIAIVFFLIIMVASIWIMVKETGKN
ncbi:MAG: hypothetical protein ABIE55_04540 [Candidatus Aenigmatarchaeota archaeon]